MPYVVLILRQSVTSPVLIELKVMAPGKRLNWDLMFDGHIYSTSCNELGCVRGQYHTTMNKHNPLKV